MFRSFFRSKSILTRSLLLAALGLALQGCAGLRDKTPDCPVCPKPEIGKPEPKAPPMAPADFADLPGWQDDQLVDAWPAYVISCKAMRNRAHWSDTCSQAATVPPGDAAAIRSHFETLFRPYRMTNPDASTTGLVTGYYEPLLRGSLRKHASFLHPLYAPPDDLIVVDLSQVAPETKNLRLRGRLEGRRLVPYHSRSDIERGLPALQGKELVWVDDAIEAFFLQIQGSGRVQLEDGRMMRIGYADQNGHPYKSIGRYLIDQGQLQPGEASMQGIQAWARANPDRLTPLLDQNPSYVFFRTLDTQSEGPIGAQGVPLTAERSVAVDPRFIPLGAPVWLATTRPNSSTPLRRLVLAQDTGGAIRGPVRADFFWGFGPAAGQEAGRMKQQGEMWVLLPRSHPAAAE
jgi:membrane-bound lytic murein transglycosylase A